MALRPGCPGDAYRGLDNRTRSRDSVHLHHGQQLWKGRKTRLAACEYVAGGYPRGEAAGCVPSLVEHPVQDAASSCAEGQAVQAPSPCAGGHDFMLVRKLKPDQLPPQAPECLYRRRCPGRIRPEAAAEIAQ